jgi:hypothetical protein
VLAPLTIFVHELGHYLAALSLGFDDPRLHFSHVDTGDAGGRPRWQVGLVGLAGPAVTAALIPLAILCGRSRPKARWPFALAAAAASRFLVGVPYTLVSLVVRARGAQLDPPAFDEFRAAEALGWSGDMLLGLSSLLFFAALFWLARGLPRGERSAAWVGLSLGTIAGWVLWFGIGPMILP